MRVTQAPSARGYLQTISHKYVSDNRTYTDAYIVAVIRPLSGVYEGEKPGVMHRFQVVASDVSPVTVGDKLVVGGGATYRVVTSSLRAVAGFEPFFEGDCKLDKTL